jgi:hypothetical protein
VAIDESGWLTLYLDPEDGRFWEESFESSEMHGGGPPTLRIISANDAKLKFSLKSNR